MNFASRCPEKQKTAKSKRIQRNLGGKKGIRTLERVLAVTRFPIVRLRPAQPSFQIYGVNFRSRIRLIYYSTHFSYCQGDFLKYFNFVYFDEKYVKPGLIPAQISGCYCSDRSDSACYFADSACCSADYSADSDCSD